MNAISGRAGCGDVCEDYRVSLEGRVEQGNWDLVCRDVELCDTVERLLKEGDAQRVHAPLGLQPLAVMEASLKAPPTWGHSTGGQASSSTPVSLGMITKAFEVLERATLNLYLCPWRKEYRVIKMFSGMFTHLVRPALSKQQIEHLFGLLGYRVRGEELELIAPPQSAPTLLRFACAFFAARCECRLLSSAAATLGGGVFEERLLVEERQKGHSLQRALENSQEKMATTKGVYREDHPAPLEADLDLYTAEGQGCNGETESWRLGETATVRENQNLSRSNSFQAAGGSSTSPQRESVCVSTLMHQLNRTGLSGPGATPESAERPRGTGGVRNDSDIPGEGMSQGQGHICACLSNHSLYTYKCEQCQKIHSGDCKTFEMCKMAGHSTSLTDVIDYGPREGGVLATPQEGAHFSEELQSPEDSWSPCKKTDPSSPEGALSCLTYTDLPTVVNRRPSPLTKHSCVYSPSTNKLVCLTCRVLHCITCNMGEMCFQLDHHVRGPGTCMVKQGCRNPPTIQCRHCGIDLCKDCWYRDPLNCICGQPLKISSEV